MIDSVIPFFCHPATPVDTCSSCGAGGDQVPVYRFNQHAPVCLRCLLAVQDDVPAGLPYLGQEVRDLNLGGFVIGWLTQIGLSPRETKAELGRVNGKLVAAIKATEPETMTDLLCGRRPAGGFGLPGTSGIGKTQAVSAILRTLLTNAWRRSAHRIRLGYPWTAWASVRWLNWPALALRWRLDPLRSTEEMEDELRACSSCPMLALDDIGLEARKDAEADRVTSVLLGIVAARDRADLPILWTSNLKDEDELCKVYGAHFVRRLTRTNPIVDTTAVPLF